MAFGGLGLAIVTLGSLGGAGLGPPKRFRTRDMIVSCLALGMRFGGSGVATVPSNVLATSVATVPLPCPLVWP